MALSVDALSEVALTGVVKIAPLGDASSGVTTYDVTVTVSGEDERQRRYERLRRNHRERRRRRDLIPTDAARTMRVLRRWSGKRAA
ncbi:MAG: hypothetical protein ACLS7Z_04050 [Christensenellales bacterium]